MCLSALLDKVCPGMFKPVRINRADNIARTHGAELEQRAPQIASVSNVVTQTPYNTFSSATKTLRHRLLYNTEEAAPRRFCESFEEEACWTNTYQSSSAHW